MVTHETFDWSKTERELVIFIPNFGRKKYIDFFLSKLTTDKWLHKDQWMILIGNDGVHETFDEWKQPGNVEYFTIPRENCWERGDAFGRNVAIKNCRSELFGQKDPEILYTGDFIQGCFDNREVLYRCGGNAFRCYEEQTKLYMEYKINQTQLLAKVEKIPIMEDRFVFYHFGYCIPTRILKEVNGYDEDFKYYGFVDTDLHRRLMKLGVKQHFDYSVQPIHLWHEKPAFQSEPVAIKRYEYNRRIFEEKGREGHIIANKNNLNWGTGDLEYVPEIV